MSARITIQSGISAGTSHRIERAVARVGSDPQSDVCLPTANVPSHALTLEFKDDACRVYNRCRDAVYIGTQVVAPDAVVVWPDTDILQLGGDIELLLDFNDDPVAAYDYGDVDEPEQQAAPPLQPVPSEPSAHSQTGTTKTIIQLGVTVLCVVGCVLLLVRDANRGARKADAPKFSVVIADAIASDKTSPDLIRRLQFAETLNVRGDSKAARTHFVTLRDDLIAQRDQLVLNQRTSELAILKFLETRLSELE